MSKIREKLDSIKWEDLFEEKEKSISNSALLKDTIQGHIEEFVLKANSEKMKREKNQAFCNKFNSDIKNKRLNNFLQLSQELETDKERKKYIVFKWDHLVGQEIDMWILLSSEKEEKISKKDFDFTCKRRGFDKYMIDYIKECLDFLNISIVENDPIFENSI